MDGVDLSNNGERMTPDAGGWAYYTHLSLYEFAGRFVKEMDVLDAGCGTGYGTAHILRFGPRSVDGCDIDPQVINFCQRVYRDPRLHFRAADLCRDLPYDSASFDIVFSTNTMEHLADIDHFLAETARILKPEGALLAVLPPITHPQALRVNIENTFHVTNLTPLGWHAKLSRFFETVDCYMQFQKPDTEPRETDFDFPPATIKELSRRHDNCAAIFLARGPRATFLPSSLVEQLPYEWHHGALVASILAEERARLHSEIRIRDKAIADFQRLLRNPLKIFVHVARAWINGANRQ